MLVFMRIEVVVDAQTQFLPCPVRELVREQVAVVVIIANVRLKGRRKQRTGHTVNNIHGHKSLALISHSSGRLTLC